MFPRSSAELFVVLRCRFGLISATAMVGFARLNGWTTHYTYGAGVIQEFNICCCSFTLVIS